MIKFQESYKGIFVLFIAYFSVLNETISQELATSPLDSLPNYIRVLTNFGQRADWSRDSKRILFIEKPFGDVYEVVM